MSRIVYKVMVTCIHTISVPRNGHCSRRLPAPSTTTAQSLHRETFPDIKRSCIKPVPKKAPGVCNVHFGLGDSYAPITYSMKADDGDGPDLLYGVAKGIGVYLEAV
jgi:hypothetical protein